MCNMFFSVSSDKLFVLQLAVWGLRGVARVILANNPLCGALILAALYWASPWQGLLGCLGVLVSTLTAVIVGQDRWKDMHIQKHTHTHIVHKRKVHICMYIFSDLCILKAHNRKMSLLNS